MANAPMKPVIDPKTWFVGLWIGIDPLDGAEYTREFVPIPGEDYKFAFTGRLEYSQICGGPPPQGGQVTDIPDVTDLMIPALLTGTGIVDLTTNSIKAAIDLTCFGDEDPIAKGVPAEFVPVGHDLLLEVPSFRANDPIWLHRASPYYKPLTYEYH